MAENLISSVDEFLTLSDVTTETVAITSLGGKKVQVRSLSLRQQKDIRKAATKRNKDGSVEIDGDIYEKGTFLYGLVHPQFSEAQFDLLLDKNATAVAEVLNAIRKVSKDISEDEAEAEVAKAQENFQNGSLTLLNVSTSGNAGEDGSGTGNGNIATS